MLKNGKLTTKALALAFVSALPSLAAAEGTLTIRGGYGTSLSDYPFVGLEDTGRVYEADYGSGLYSHVAYSNASLFGSFGGEASLTFNKFSGDASAIDPDYDCGLRDLLGRETEDCESNAGTTNDTQFGQLRVMATYEHPNGGTQFLGGLGAIDLSSDSRNYLPEHGSSTERTTDFAGFGFVAGARKAIPITNQALLQLEGFAGAYSGDRELRITDTYLDFGGGRVTEEFSRTQKQNVISLDLSASVAMPIQSLKPGSYIEVGVAYSRLFNVMDAANYNEDSADAVPFKRKPGSFEDDIDALSLFFGLQIPL